MQCDCVTMCNRAQSVDKRNCALCGGGRRRPISTSYAQAGVVHLLLE